MPTDPLDGGMTRRSFVKNMAALGALSVAGLISCDSISRNEKKTLKGSIKGANWKAGHILNRRETLSPSETERTGVVIVGGGISGLSAAWSMQKKGFSDFLLLDLDDKAGGNSTSGSNQVSSYPWGAHYVPIPGEEAVYVRELFEELGVIEGYDRKGLPVYNEYYLCSAPHERLFIHGRWQDGLVPQTGITERDRNQYMEFFRAMDSFRDARGSDGRRAFSIPVDFSSRDPRFLRYDGISMARYMSDNGWDSKNLLWYVNYCCRDDYGSGMEAVSAWAGIHYFASRSGRAANAEPQSVLTWPEGNGWIVKKLEEKLRRNIRCNACVINIETVGGDLAVDYYDVKKERVTRVMAKAVIYAAPRFTAIKAIKDLREAPPAYAKEFGYAPWMVANVTVNGIPEGKGAPLSWDNVSFYSDSLGYVAATHQDVTLHRDKTVLTFYQPLNSGEPSSERRRAIGRSHGEWADMVIKDLSQVHPGIENMVEELDVWVWGHAMIRPVPGFIWGNARSEALKPHGNIHFAHSDMSGISIFEEAQYRGVTAANSVLRRLGHL